MAKPVPISRGEPDAHELGVEQLYEAHAPFVRALVSRLLGPSCDPSDGVQEVVMIAWRKLPGQRLENPRAWLCGIALRVCAAVRRRRKVRRFLGIEAAAEVVDPRTPESDLDLIEAAQRAYGILESLPEKKRSVFVLYELAGLDCQTIADALSCPLKTVHTRLFHARAAFSAALRAAPRSTSTSRR